MRQLNSCLLDRAGKLSQPWNHQQSPALRVINNGIRHSFALLLGCPWESALLLKTARPKSRTTRLTLKAPYPTRSRPGTVNRAPRTCIAVGWRQWQLAWECAARREGLRKGSPPAPRLASQPPRHCALGRPAVAPPPPLPPTLLPGLQIATWAHGDPTPDPGIVPYLTINIHWKTGRSILKSNIYALLHVI